jgi:hypothetical protein
VDAILGRSYHSLPGPLEVTNICAFGLEIQAVGAVFVPLGIILALQLSIMIRRLTYRRVGEMGAWTAGAVFGFPPGAIVFLLAFGNRDHLVAVVLYGAVGGLIAGAIVGPVCGAMRLSRNRNLEGSRLEQVHVAQAGLLMALVAFVLGVLAVLYLIA